MGGSCFSVPSPGDLLVVVSVSDTVYQKKIAEWPGECWAVWGHGGFVRQFHSAICLFWFGFVDIRHYFFSFLGSFGTH